jgi:adenylate kinase
MNQANLSVPAGAVFGLFGISGVGKTWLAQNVVAQVPELLHLEASALLRVAHQAEGEALRRSPRRDLVASQQALAAAFEKARAGCPERPVLISAHSVIDNDIELVDVPFAAIEPLAIEHYVFLRAESEVIASRRAQSTRQRPHKPASVLAAHQQRALEVCQSYSRASGSPVTVLDLGEAGDAITKLVETIRNHQRPLDR